MAVARDPSAARELVRRERLALRISAVGGGVLAAVALIWGWLAGSGVILFDGVFAAAGIVLVSVSVLASHAADAAPTARYPFGRHAATPMAVVIQGAALLATMLYGLVDSVAVLVAGGSDGAPLHLLAYGAVAAVGATVLALLVRRSAPGSTLALAEVVSWRAGAWLSVVIAIGGGVGIALQRSAYAGAARYVDPVLLLVAVLLLAPAPVRLLRQGTHQLLEGAPDPAVAAAVDRAVAAVQAQFDLPAPRVRGSQVGDRLYVEADFLVAPGRWTVDQEDAVRRAVIAGLDELGLDVWATVDLTTDPGYDA
ncbi:MAG TPA: cation transporter [Cellulomonas sp.]